MTARLVNQQTYRMMLLLASGIQMAGPELTPETFERGLQRAQFPNPTHPNRQGRVGFEGGSHAMMQDVVGFWWSFDVAPPDSQTAPAPCYLNDARRYQLGEIPARRRPFFAGRCDTGPPGGRNELP